MKKYGVNELRKMFLDFFETKDHLVMKSFSLVPQNDKSLLLINAGMAPLKPYFTGAEIPPKKRVATCQKCIRTGDIDNVGKTARHGTFFEMLGNFSFGDYFKHEAIAWSWEFLTEVVGLDPDRLYPSVYEDDDEAFDIWNKEVGIAPERIYRFGKADNFWEHGAGPCGPCSEIYYDRGEKYGCGKEGCTVGCDCDRYMEVWNNVFTQFENDGKGHYETLQNKNIDTGMGLERLAVAVQDVDSMFDVDTIRALREEVCRIAGKVYKENEKDDISIRVITDHIRSASFLISDGVIPSNEGRGYVLRRLIRRAARHGRLLGIKDRFLAELSKTVIDSSKDGYPELDDNKAMIFEVLNNEEQQFDRTIDTGLKILAEFEDEMQKAGTSVLEGAKAFRLFDTYGFPLDLTTEILAEKNMTVDEEGFKAAMENQRVTARNARKVQNYMGRDMNVYDLIDPSVTTEFTGYTTLTDESTITVLTSETELVDTLTEGQVGTIITEKSPFYATMGGQVGDTGIIASADGEFKVEETIKLDGDKRGHKGVMVKGSLKVGDKVNMTVTSAERSDTEKNHSATHILQKALKLVLGDHVAQKGSYVDPYRLRFDFVHFKAMSEEEIRRVEDMVNEKIREALEVRTDVMTIEEARETGAMALFDEKYGDKVRVVSIGDFSKEFCGGTHVRNAAEIQAFKIVSESGIAAGVRRIEALTGSAVFEYYRQIEKTLNEAAGALRTQPAEIPEKIRHMADEIKSLNSEIESLKAKLAQQSMGDVASDVTEKNGIKVLARRVDGSDPNGLRTLSDQLKDSLGECVLVLASVNDGKLSFMAAASDGAVKAGAHAGNIIREITKVAAGKGGGRPNMAQGGGSDLSKADEALALGLELALGQLN
ncbi:MAG: alanine--tRNA ligase [Lachnospiraceae bacterium]|nr:alanine--tRNA ligase [Lachnospiraceae bacterium]